MPLFKYFILIKEERYARSAMGSAPFRVLARMEEGDAHLSEIPYSRTQSYIFIIRAPSHCLGLLRQEKRTCLQSVPSG